MPSKLITQLKVLFNQIFENKLFRRVLRNSGYLFSATGISAFLSMIQGILAARLLGVSLFGVLGTITMFISVVNKLASFRMGELVVKFVGEYEEEGDPQRAAAVFKVAALVEMVTSLIAYLLVRIFAPLGAQYFAKDISLADYFSFYALIILFNLITESSTGLLQLSDRYRRLAGWNVIQSIFTLAVILAAFIGKGNLVHILTAYMLGKAVGAFGLLFNALHEASQRWGPDWWKVSMKLIQPRARELSSFAVSTNLSASISLVTKDSEVLWVSLFRPNDEVGYYKLALSLANMVQLPTNPLPQVTYPELSREVSRKNWHNVRYLLRQGSLLAGTYAGLATLALIVLGRPFIRLIYGQEFLPAFPALIILLIGYIVADIFYWRRIALLSFGRADFPVKLNSILSVVKVIGAVTLIPRYGYLASAGLLAGFYWIGSIVSWQKVRQLLREGEQA